jgi:hypothetical protein
MAVVAVDRGGDGGGDGGNGKQQTMRTVEKQ